MTTTTGPATAVRGAPPRGAGGHGTGRVADAVRRGAPTIVGVVVLLVLWELAGRAGLAKGFVLTPGEALQPLLDPQTRDVYARAAAATFGAAAVGLLWGGGLAIVFALVAVQVPGLTRHVDRLAALANSAPWVAVGPVVLVVLGPDSGPTAIAAIAVFFYIFVATSVGLGAASRAGHDWFSSLGATRWQRLWSLQAPRALPSFLGGLKLAAPAAIAGAVYGEWYGADRGLGVLLVSAMRSAHPEDLWAASIVAAAGGLLAYGVLSLAQQRATRRFGGGLAGHRAASTPRRGAWRRVGRAARTVAEVLVVAALLFGVWQAWISLGEVSPLVAPGPRSVLEALWEDPGPTVTATLHTLATAGVALAVGTVIALLVVAASWWSRVAAGLLVPGLVLLSATPLVALFPLFSRVFGYSGVTVTVIATFMVVLPLFVYGRSGLTAWQSQHRDVVASLGGSRLQEFATLVVPSALPHLSTGLRVAAGSSVVAAVIGESLIGTEGLGVQFTYSYALLQMQQAFGAALVIVVVSLTVFTAFGWIERAVHARFDPAP